jgi:hypothetical protein
MSNEPRLELLYQISVYLDPPLAIGEHPGGNRLIVPITGGSFEGPRLKGKVLAGGADWLLVRSDGVGVLDVRYPIQTVDGALIYVHYSGYLTRVLELFPRWSAGERIPHEEYYFVATPRYETSAPQYAWLQQVVVLSIGYLIPGGVGNHVFAVRHAQEENAQE